MRLVAAFSVSLVAFGLAWISVPAHADEDVYTLTIKDHKFSPEQLEVPADKKVKLLVKNDDTTAEEFDSSDLRREKVVPAGKEAVIYIGPLSAGTYKFVGEYHEATAHGEIIVK